MSEAKNIKENSKNQEIKFSAGDSLKVYSIIKEGDKQRTQVFAGVCIKKKNAGIGSTFTVRKISNGVGVERIFPLHSPKIEKIEVESKGAVRKSKLYYIRDLKGKAARIKKAD